MIRLRIILTLSLSLAVGLSWAGPNKLSDDLPQHGVEKVDVIVQFKAHPLAEDLDEIRGNSGALKKKLPLIRGGLFSMPVSALQGLSHNPKIKFVTPDREVRQANDFSRAAVGVDTAHGYGLDGTGRRDRHHRQRNLREPGPHEGSHRPDARALQRGLRHRQQLRHGHYGHGTHVAGVAAGDGYALYSKAYTGMAPNATLIDLRVLDQDGSGTDSAVIVAIQRAIDLKDTYNIRVINLSLGRGIFESYELDPLCQAVEAAYDAGIVVVASAGNFGRDDTDGRDGYGTITSPGNDPFVITVGAMKTMGTYHISDDSIASYSSKGPPRSITWSSRISWRRATGSSRCGRSTGRCRTTTAATSSPRTTST